MSDKYNKRLNYLKYLFKNLKDFNINETNINYIYFKIPEWCCNYIPDPMFDNINPFEFNKVRELLINIYDSEKYDNTKFLLDIKEIKNEQDTIIVDPNDYELNELILNYIKCRPNIKILTQFSNKKLNFDNCYLYATKELNLLDNGIAVLIYELFSLTEKFKEYTEIDNYIKLLNKNKNKIKIYIFEPKVTDIILDIDISCDFITPDFISAINIAEIYFNKNSIDHMNEMLLEKFLDKDFNRTRLLLNTFKKMLFVRKISLLEQTKFMLVSGSVLATYGIRKSTDIDFWISDLPESIDNSTLNKITDILLQENNKLFFLDGKHPKVVWPDFWKEYHKIWASKFGANNMLECIHNPKYHYYFCGIKLLILNADIERRQMRERPAAVADIIMINRLLHKNIELNPIRKNYINFTNDNIIVKPNQFLKTVYYWLKKKYKTNITEDEEKSIIFI